MSSCLASIDSTGWDTVSGSSRKTVVKNHAIRLSTSNKTRTCHQRNMGHTLSLDELPHSAKSSHSLVQSCTYLFLETNSMHPFLTLQKIVGEAGGIVLEDNLSADFFDSGWSIYQCGAKKLRLVWDGKDGRGFLQRFVEPDSWQDTEPFITKDDIESVPQNEAKIEAFRHAANALLVQHQSPTALR
jgi:hypothetical protein